MSGASLDLEKGPHADSLVFPRPLLGRDKAAIRSLFAGAIGAFKNPGSHRTVDESDPKQVMRLLIFASALLEMIDRAKPT